MAGGVLSRLAARRLSKTRQEGRALRNDYEGSARMVKPIAHRSISVFSVSERCRIFWSLYRGATNVRGLACWRK
jgi:hypothetical protein